MHLRLSFQFTAFVKILCLGISVLASGCGRKSVETISVQGIVTYKGQPVTVGEIAFYPIDVAAGLPRRIATGKIDAQGGYSLSTFTKDDGVIPGDYKVVIISKEKPTSFEVTEAELAALKTFVPRIYGDLTKTPLKETISVNSDEPLRLNFELEGEL